MNWYQKQKQPDSLDGINNNGGYMKLAKSLLMGLTVALAMTATAKAADLPSEKEVVVGINDAYVPGGFDASSDVFVVVNGIFPNGCYKWSRADVNHKTTSLHEVKSVARVSQGMCLMVLVPFTKEVQMGVLGAGDHKVRFLNGDGTYLEKDLTIE
jgi:hypothetical protein